MFRLFSRLSLQVEAIRRGIGAVIPVQLLRLFSWDDLEMFVCGQEGVDIDLLEACTEYNLCSREDRHVSAFWDVLRSFSQKEKSLFLRCVYCLQAQDALSARPFRTLCAVSTNIAASCAPGI